MMIQMSGRTMSGLPAARTSSPALTVRLSCLSRQTYGSSQAQGISGLRRSGRVQRMQTFQIRASSASADVTTEGSGVAEAHPIVPLVAAAGFAAAWFQKYTVHREHVLIALAAVALANSALSVVKTGVHADWVSLVAAPAVLAWHALNLRFHYMEVAIAIFGWYLCRSLEGPALAWAATLGVALYSRMGAEWYCAAYGVVAGWKLLRGYQKDSKVAFQMLPPVLASAWALYKKCPLTWTIIIMLSQIAGSAFGMGLSMTNELNSSK